MMLEFALNNNESCCLKPERERGNIERIKELTRQLNRARHAYYMQAREIMSNQQYDNLLDELKNLEKVSNFRLANSPTNQVGSKVVGKLKKVHHPIKLLSLEKTKSIEPLRKLLGYNDGLVSLKIDGLTLFATYSGGKLVGLATRGDGEVGEDVFHNAAAVLNLPLHIPYKGLLYVTGEGAVGFSDFETINSALPPEDQYSNPRNLAAGSIRQLDSGIASKRRVSFNVFRIEAPDKLFSHKSEALEWGKKLGFNIVEYQKVHRDKVGQVVNSLQLMVGSLDLPVDGLVVTLNNIEVSKSLGTTSKYPKDSLSFKWQDELVGTALTGVIWQTGRTGVITPVAVFSPVELDGKTVTRATLHNVSYLRKLQLGIGDHIGIFDANMVIPQVGENYTRSDTLVIPDTCPVCNGAAEIIKPNEAEILLCLNDECPAKLVQRLTHFVKREAFNIEGLSRQTLEKFVEKEFIRDLPDIFLLSTYKDEIVAMPGFGEKSFINLIESIDRARDIALHRFVYSLGGSLPFVQILSL